jgi:prepilin-type N-terminal cleavage/methylation domain-containing protein/prepilin-type processing-associated H-X9-DG protein
VFKSTHDELLPAHSAVSKRLSTKAGGFTLLELLVSTCIIGILAGMLMPSLAAAKGKARATLCLGHLKELQTAWQLYVDDHQNRVPINHAALSHGAWRSTPDSWVGQSSAPSDTDSASIEAGTFYQLGYVRDLELYRCPADLAKASSGKGASGSVRRLRSYALNGNWCGRKEEEQAVVKVFTPDRASELFVFIDEAEDSIDDGHFLVWSDPDTRWVNLPAGRHGRTGTLSFADGHAELWHWRWPKRFHRKSGYWKPAENAKEMADLRRLQSAIIPLP